MVHIASMLQAWETPRIQNLHFGKPIPKREPQNQIMPSCSFIGSSKKKHCNSKLCLPKWPFHLWGTVLKKSSVLTQPISRNHRFISLYIYIAIVIYNISFDQKHQIISFRAFRENHMVPPRHQLRGTSWSEPSSAWQWKWNFVDINRCTRPGQRLHNELERSTMLSMGKSM